MRGIDIIRTSSGYSLPASVARYVSYVGELIRFPRIRTSRVVTPTIADDPTESPFNACGLRGCAGFTTPAVLQERCVCPTGSALLSRPCVLTD